MSEWTIWAGLLLHRMVRLVECPGAKTIRQLAPFSPCLIFSGVAVQSLCRRCAEVQLDGCKPGCSRTDCQPDCCVDIIVAWCGMMSRSKVVMNHMRFILKVHPFAYRAFQAYFFGGG